MNLKKYLLAASLAAASLSASAWDETGYYYPDQEPDDIWSEWEPYYDCDIEWSGLNAGFFSYDTKVKRRVAKDPENHKWQWAFVEYFAAGTDLIVEYDPDTKTLRVPVMRKGVNNMWDGEPFLACGWKEFHGTDDPYSKWDDVNGILELYRIDYYPNQDLGDGTYGDRIYAQGIDIFRFKGFAKYDVDIQIDECVASRNVTATLVMTAHPQNVSWELLGEYVGKYDTEKLARIAERKANPITGTTSVDLTLKEGVNSLVVSSYDNNGNLVSSIKNIYCMPEEADQWTSLGMGKFTDDAVLGLSDGWLPTTVEVEIQENKSKPGYYRLVDPYKEIAAKWDGLEYTHSAHKHYLYIDASRPKQIMFEPAATGVSHPAQLKDIYLTSKAYEEKRAGKLQPEYTEYLGLMENGIISFPEGALGVRLPEYTAVVGEDLIYWVNNGGEFTVEFPSVGIDGVAADVDAQTRYYTLQGIAIDTPEEGQVVIMRRGNKAVKAIYRR